MSEQRGGLTTRRLFQEAFSDQSSYQDQPTLSIEVGGQVCDREHRCGEDEVDRRSNEYGHGELTVAQYQHQFIVFRAGDDHAPSATTDGTGIRQRVEVEDLLQLSR